MDERQAGKPLYGWLRGWSLISDLDPFGCAVVTMGVAECQQSGFADTLMVRINPYTLEIVGCTAVNPSGGSFAYDANRIPQTFADVALTAVQENFSMLTTPPSKRPERY
jgi:hypothetical protein